MFRSSSNFIWYLLGGLLLAVAVGYFYTLNKWHKAEEQKKDVDEKYERYLKNYNPQGEGKVEQDELLKMINKRNKELTQQRDEYKKSLEMKFPEYVAGLYSRAATEHVGTYFRRMLSNVLEDLRKSTAERGADMENIGNYLIFKEEDIANPPNMESEAEQQLQYLAIAEMIVKRAAQAKADQEKYEAARNVPADKRISYMKFLKLSYKPPRRTAPVKLAPNPKHKEWQELCANAATRKGAGQGPAKFIGTYYEPFIVEFPVEMEMICDDKSLIRFLASLQETNKVLTIQRIQIVSPGIDLAPGRTKPDELKMAYEQHVYVKISATGMIFKPLDSNEKWTPPAILGSEVVYTPQTSKPVGDKQEFPEPKGY